MEVFKSTLLSLLAWITVIILLLPLMLVFSEFFKIGIMLLSAEIFLVNTIMIHEWRKSVKEG